MRLILLYLIWKALGKDSRQEFPLVFTFLNVRLGRGRLSLVYEIDRGKSEGVDESERKKLY
jgi:hypothetical protein